MRLKAMAKINLGLDVLEKREDGYHESEDSLRNRCKGSGGAS